MKILREGGLGSLLLAGLAVACVAMIFTTLSARGRASEAEKAKEAAVLEANDLIVLVELKQKELDAAVAKTIIKYVEKRVPGKTRVDTVVKWKTKEVPVEVERIKEVIKWMGLECGDDLDWDTDITKPPPGVITGEIATFVTEKGNTIAYGFASASIAGVELIEESEFDMDATLAFRRAIRELPVHRWWVGAEYAVWRDTESFDHVSFQPDAVCADGGRIWFPRKKISIGTGGALCGDKASAVFKVFF